MACACVREGEKWWEMKRNCYRLLSVLWFNQMNIVREYKWIFLDEELLLKFLCQERAFSICDAFESLLSA